MFVTLRVWWIQFYWIFFVVSIRVAFLKEHLSVERFRTQNYPSSRDRLNGWGTPGKFNIIIVVFPPSVHARSHEFSWRLRSSSDKQTERSAFAMQVNLEWSTQQVWNIEGRTIKYEFKTMFLYNVLYCFLEGFVFYKLRRMIRFVLAAWLSLSFIFLTMFERVKWLSKSGRCYVIIAEFSVRRTVQFCL